MIKINHSEIIYKAVEYYGVPSQIQKAIEEMAELTVELARFNNNRGMNVNIIDEIADVIIMMEQMKAIFGEDLVDSHISTKLKRLGSRMQQIPGGVMIDET